MLHTKPNIVLIHCHDLGRWLSCYGMPSVPSPHLQRLADESIVFDAAFSTAPLCTPARGSLFTGLLPHQNGLMGLTHDGWRYRPGVRTLPEYLRQEGYHTVLMGLQHEDLDARVLGFDETHGLGFLPRALEVARRVKRWVRESIPDRPFFLTVGTWEVHRPWPLEDYEPADPALVDVPAFLPDNASTREDISAFHGSIRQMDEAIGSIMSALDSLPSGGNTVVFFTTDHGAAFPGAKSTLYDPGVGVALIVRPPRSWNVAPGRRQHLVSHLDVVPTAIELAGGIPPDSLEGRSLVPLLEGTPPDPEDRELVLEKTYHDEYDPIRALRTRDAKYIRNFPPSRPVSYPADLEESRTLQGMAESRFALRKSEELYLLDRDPNELENLADEAKYHHLKTRLAERLVWHMRRTADPLLAGEISPPPVPERGERTRLLASQD